MKVALIQLNASFNKDDNIRRAMRLAKEAIEKRAKFILLPEVYNYRGPLSGHLAQVAEFLPGVSIRPLMELARKHQVFILAGSVYEKIKGQRRVGNTSVLISRRGKIAAKYRKQNLFSAQIGLKSIKESDHFVAGKNLAMATVESFKVGLTVCYDLRFPRLYKEYAQKGVDVLCVPSSFTYPTGKAHWEILLRARAIENLSYVLAPNQIGTDHRGIKYFGHSMVVSPWGEILAQASGNKEEIVYFELTKERIADARKKLPSIRGGKNG